MILHLALACQLAAGAAQQHASPRSLTPEIYLSLRTPAEPSISPDGRRVAYTVQTPDLASSDIHEEIWVAELRAPAGAAAQPVQLTRTSSGAYSPAWSPDGRFLAYLSDDPAPGADPDEATTQVWLLPMEGGMPRLLTESPTGVEQFAWLPDGAGVAYIQEADSPRAVAALRERRTDASLDERVVGGERPRHELWAAALDGGGERLWRGEPGLSEFRVSPDGAWIVVVSNPTGDPDDDRLDDLWILPAEGGEPRRLTTRPGGEYGPRFSPDGRWLAFTALRDSSVTYSNDELWVMDLAACRSAPASPCPAFDVSAPLDRDVYEWRWAGADRLLATFAVGAYAHLFRITLAGEGRPARIEPLVADTVVFNDIEVAPDGRTAVAVLEGPSQWPDLWAVDLAAAGPERAAGGAGGRASPARAARPSGAAPQRAAPGRRNLTGLNPVLDSLVLAPQEVVSWTAPDGERVEGVLVRPTSGGAGPRPLLVVVHGGPHGNQENILRGYYTMQLFAARGYAVLAPNFRGSTGCGNRWATLNREDLGGGDWRDILSGVDAMVARGIADSARLAIKGQSYGGYMANWAVTRTDRFKAAISESGIASLATDYSSSNIPSFEWDYLRAYHWENQRLYSERSPLSAVNRIRTPMLIMHGDDDPNTAPVNSVELWRALRTLGRTVEFVRYPREGHGLDEPAHRLDAFRRQIAWLDRWVLRGGGAPDSYAAGEEVPAADSTLGWTMTVASVDWEPSYAGSPDSAAYAEVTILFRRAGTAAGSGAPGPRRTPLALDWTRDVTLDGTPPLGVPVEALSETLLVEGSGLRTAVAADSDAEAAAVRLVFPAAATTGPRTLRVRGFAPVLLER